VWVAEAVSSETVRPLREEVLRPGQSGEQLTFAGDESPETLHAAITLDGRLVGVASVIRDGHPRRPQPGDWRIRGMATTAQMRGRGIGAALLALCESHAREHDGHRLWCNARVGARDFYERGGFAVEGEMFEIPAIGAHLLMWKCLTDERSHAGSRSLL